MPYQNPFMQAMGRFQTNQAGFTNPFGYQSPTSGRGTARTAGNATPVQPMNYGGQQQYQQPQMPGMSMNPYIPLWQRQSALSQQQAMMANMTQHNDNARFAQNPMPSYAGHTNPIQLTLQQAKAIWDNTQNSTSGFGAEGYAPVPEFNQTIAKYGIDPGMAGGMVKHFDTMASSPQSYLTPNELSGAKAAGGDTLGRVENIYNSRPMPGYTPISTPQNRSPQAMQHVPGEDEYRTRARLNYSLSQQEKAGNLYAQAFGTSPLEQGYQRAATDAVSGNVDEVRQLHQRVSQLETLLERAMGRNSSGGGKVLNITDAEGKLLQGEPGAPAGTDDHGRPVAALPGRPPSMTADQLRRFKMGEDVGGGPAESTPVREGTIVRSKTDPNVMQIFRNGTWQPYKAPTTQPSV